VLNAEANAERFAQHGTGVVLRFGMFYGHDAMHTKTQIRTAKTGFSPFLGPDEAYQAMIHLDDAGSAVVAALGSPSGAWNITDDEPLTRAQATAALTEALGKRRLRKAPSLLLKSGGATFASLTRSQRVSNKRFKDATGWAPRYANAREGLPAVVQLM
jgi:nucleoside-diphosphate-sugar epimerase